MARVLELVPSLGNRKNLVRDRHYGIGKIKKLRFMTDRRFSISTCRLAGTGGVTLLLVLEVGATRTTCIRVIRERVNHGLKLHKPCSMSTSMSIWKFGRVCISCFSSHSSDNLDARMCEIHLTCESVTLPHTAACMRRCLGHLLVTARYHILCTAETQLLASYHQPGSIWT